MGDFVGVNPQLLRQLAARLHDLAGVLAKEGPAIVSAMQNQDHRLDLSAFGQVGTRSGEDSQTMIKRADLAMELQNQTVSGNGLNADAVFAPLATQPPNFVSLIPDPAMIEVPWDITDQQYTVEATGDANRLQAALANPGASGSTDTITQVGALLTDHIDDKTYMQAFFAAGGLSSAQQVARALHTVDGTTNNNQVLSSSSQQILAMYGNALASATMLQARGDINSLDVNELKNPPNGDMWSEGMLFKYGPSGDQWDDKALAATSAAMLDWRKSTQVRPDYTAPTGGSAGGFTDPSNAWYASLGLAVDYVDHNAPPDVLAARLAGIQDNDPSIALMQRLSENAGAARDLLGGNDDASRGYAHDLVNDKWATPQEFGGAADDSLWPGRVIETATLDRVTSPQIAALSAQAAANVFQAGADNYSDSGLKADEKDLYKGLPPHLSMSLASMATGYLTDLAQNTDWGDPTGADGNVVNVPFGPKRWPGDDGLPVDGHVGQRRRVEVCEQPQWHDVHGGRERDEGSGNGPDTDGTVRRAPGTNGACRHQGQVGPGGSPRRRQFRQSGRRCGCEHVAQRDRWLHGEHPQPAVSRQARSRRPELWIRQSPHLGRAPDRVVIWGIVPGAVHQQRPERCRGGAAGHVRRPEEPAGSDR